MTAKLAEHTAVSIFGLLHQFTKLRHPTTPHQSYKEIHSLAAHSGDSSSFAAQHQGLLPSEARTEGQNRSATRLSKPCKSVELLQHPAFSAFGRASGDPPQPWCTMSLLSSQWLGLPPQTPWGTACQLQPCTGMNPAVIDNRSSHKYPLADCCIAISLEIYRMINKVSDFLQLSQQDSLQMKMLV